MDIKKAFIPALISTFLGCGSLTPTTEFERYSEASYPKKDPCDVKIIKKLPKELSEYVRIGICRSKKTAGGLGGDGENKALEAVWNCACEHGADYAIIQVAEIGKETWILHDEKQRRTYYKDFVVADIYKERQ